MRLSKILVRSALAFLAVLSVAAVTPDASARPNRPAAGRPQPQLRLEPLEIATVRGTVKFTVEMAETESTRETGMMFRTSMAANRGMLFVFQDVRPVAFWMHNTLIPLDIIYIGPTGRVISIARNAIPRDDTPLPSGGPVRGVLEIRGGRAAELGILPGDLVRHRIFPR